MRIGEEREWEKDNDAKRNLIWKIQLSRDHIAESWMQWSWVGEMDGVGETDACLNIFQAPCVQLVPVAEVFSNIYSRLRHANPIKIAAKRTIEIRHDIHSSPVKISRI